MMSSCWCHSCSANAYCAFRLPAELRRDEQSTFEHCTLLTWIFVRTQNKNISPFSLRIQTKCEMTFPIRVALNEGSHAYTNVYCIWERQCLCIALPSYISQSNSYYCNIWFWHSTIPGMLYIHTLMSMCYWILHVHHTIHAALLYYSKPYILMSNQNY